MAIADDITALYVSILRRQPDSAGLAGYVAAVNAGATLADIGAAITASPEAKIVAIYERELGRAPEPLAVQRDIAFLARGGSPADIANVVAASIEATGAVDMLYQQVLSRRSALGDFNSVLADQQALSNGSSLTDLRAMIAFSPESQATLGAIFLAELGRPAPAGPSAPFTQTLVNGGSLPDVRVAIANSPEITNDIVNAYQADRGTPPNAVELAAGQSMLSSGIPISAVLHDIATSVAGPLTTPENSFGQFGIAILPEAITTSSPTFIYALGNGDALISKTSYTAAPGSFVNVAFGNPNGDFMSSISYFKPATEVIQINSAQVSDFSALKISYYSVRLSYGGRIDLGSNNFINVGGVMSSDLSAANFRFV